MQPNLHAPNTSDLLLHFPAPECYLFESAYKPTLSDLLLQITWTSSASHKFASVSQESFMPCHTKLEIGLAALTWVKSIFED
jgi:hypothetical protein